MKTTWKPWAVPTCRKDLVRSITGHVAHLEQLRDRVRRVHMHGYAADFAAVTIDNCNHEQETIMKEDAMSAIEDQVRDAGKQWRQAKDAADAARAQRDAVIQRAVLQEGVTKYRVADWAGMTRVQVAAIIAKAPTQPLTSCEHLSDATT